MRTKINLDDIIELLNMLKEARDVIEYYRFYNDDGEAANEFFAMYVEEEV